MNALASVIDHRLAEQTTELKAYVRDSFEAQQIYLEARFEEIKDELDVQARIRSLEKRFEQLEAKLQK